MRYPWVNVVLLALLALVGATGFLGMVSGSERLRWLLWLHGIGSYGILAVLFWKGVVALRSLRRRASGNFARASFLTMSVVLLAGLGTGLVWAFAGRRAALGYSLMTVHVTLGLALFVFLVWHVFKMRFVLRIKESRDRRVFLRMSGTMLAGLALWAVADRATRLLSLPGASRRFTGSYETGSLTGAFPTVSWLFDSPAPVTASQWRLVIDGAVERPLTLDYQQARAMAADALTATIDCTGGWYSAQEWRGVPLARLLDLAGARDTARSVTVESVTGYGRRFSLEEARAYLLALDVAGRPLEHGHGFPARLVAPSHRGFDWVKWVTRITVNETSKLWQSPVPLQ